MPLFDLRRKKPKEITKLISDDKKKSMLLCTFIKAHQMHDKMNNIFKIFEVENDKIFSFTILSTSDECILTYNAYVNTMDYKEQISNTINVHRKKHTNTLYTINALNEIIKKINNNILDRNMKIDWELYKNSLLLIRDDELCVLKTKLFTIFSGVENNMFLNKKL